MPAPICRIGSSIAIHVARHTEQQAKATPLTIRAAINGPGDVANAYQMLDARYGTDPIPTMSRLLTRSERLPAMGRQNSETMLIMPETTPITVPVAPSSPA